MNRQAVKACTKSVKETVKACTKSVQETGKACTKSDQETGKACTKSVQETGKARTKMGVLETGKHEKGGFHLKQKGHLRVGNHGRYNVSIVKE